MPTPEPGVAFTTGGVDDMTQAVLDRQAADEAAVVDSLAELTDVDLTGAAEGDVLTVQADGSVAPASGTSGTSAGDALATAKGFLALPRAHGASEGAATVASTLALTGFNAPFSMTATKLRMVTGGTAAGATPTLCRYGLYSVDASGNLTLVGSTVNDTTLFAGTHTVYEKAMSASVDIVAGQRYACGVLVVTAAAAPSFLGATVPTAGGATIGLEAPVRFGSVSGQADLPASVAVGSVATFTRCYQFGVLP